MTTSVAVLPSSPLLTHESYAQAAPARPRPKLSLNTSVPSGMRKGSTSLSIASLSAVSLTDRNTFVNAWDPVTVPSTPFTQVLPLLPAHDTASSQFPSQRAPDVVQSPDSIRPSSSDSSPQTPVASYALSKFPRSILTNSLHPQREQHARAKRIASTAPKLMFPPVKRVCFRPQLNDEIQTVRFTWTHQDLLLSLQTPRSHAGVKRESPPPEELEQSSTDEDSHDNDDDSDERMAYAKTPVAGRKRRKGEWRWTLGPIDGDNDDDPVDASSISNERRNSDSSTSSGSSSSSDTQGWSKTLMDKIRVDEWRKAS